MIREFCLFPAPDLSLTPEHPWNCQAALRTRPASWLPATVTGFYADLRRTIILCFAKNPSGPKNHAATRS